MKIVFLIRTLTFGGAERQLVALAKGLHERGNLVKVVVFYPHGPLEPDLEASGIPVISLDKRGRFDVLPFLWRTARTLRRESPDVVHGYLGASNLLSLLLRPFHGGKSVWGVRASGMDSDHTDWLDQIDSWLESHLASFANLIIANSLSGKMNAIAMGFPASKTIVIPNGIDTDRFKPDPLARKAVRAEFGIADEHPLIGRVGRLSPQKDYPTFIRAAALIALERPDARFLCVGNGPEDLITELKSLAGSLALKDRLMWAPARSDMPAVYNAMDLCVSTSAFGEGTPNVVAEAMACGVPCVVTDIGDSAIVVGDVTAVVPAGNPELIAKKVIQRLTLIESGSVDRSGLRARIVNSLSMHALVSRSESALQALISGRSGRLRRVRKATI